MWTYVVAPRPRKEKKMKNWEKYEKEIKKIGIGNIAITKKGKLSDCRDTHCKECIGDKNGCDYAFTEWLYQEAE